MKRKVFVHAHIPKSGGNTLKYIFKKNFKKDYFRENSLISSFQFNSEEVKRGIQERYKLRVFSAHQVSLDLPYSMDGIDVIGLSFIRNPVDRFISHYFAHRHLSQKNTVSKSRELNIEQYLESTLIKGKQQAYKNGATKFLSGNKIRHGKKNIMRGSKVGIQEVNNIKNLMKEKKVFIFPLRRFDESCLLLEKVFSTDFVHCSYPQKRNISPRDQEITSSLRAKIQDYVGDLDNMLLAYSNELLDKNLLSIFENSTNLNQEKSRFFNSCKQETIKFALINPKNSLSKRKGLS